jgi:bifunctional DNA-binding transcriptional regulator/antitoxin component of YhaV-PrlF toxin-antitoxin module
MRLIEWEVSEDGYEEQIVIPKEKREKYNKC